MSELPPLSSTMASDVYPDPPLYQDLSDEEKRTAINDVESLKRGIIKTSKNKTESPYTILLVGETGVGKSSVLQLIANAVIGNDIDHYNFNILDRKNEAGGSTSQSQTNAARLYEFPSNSGVTVRVLDTPGLADTRGLEQDEIHKKSIATEIQNNIDSVNAVLILANGTVPRLTVSTDYALSTLCTIFPKILANNIAFMFTNVPDELSLNFSTDSVPAVLKHAPQYWFNNPIALQKKCLEYKKLNPSTTMGNMAKSVEHGEQRALEVLAKVFDWLDGLEPVPTAAILALFEKSQAIDQQITNIIAQMNQEEQIKKEMQNIIDIIRKNDVDEQTFKRFEKAVSTLIWAQKETSDYNTVCGHPDCYSNCHEDCHVPTPFLLRWCEAITLWSGTCKRCGHFLDDHCRFRSKWEQVTNKKVTEDVDMKRKWEKAKTGTEKEVALRGNCQSALNDLSTSIDENTQELSRLAEAYANLSLSGSFSAPISKAIKLLSQKLKGMQDDGAPKDQCDKVEASIDTMEKKLEILREAKAKNEKRIVTYGKTAVAWAQEGITRGRNFLMGSSN